ncbi:MAG: hypothetical protein ACLFUI_10390 [Halanaerobiales bacterium]
MAEYALGNWQQEGLNFIVGSLIGVDAAIWSMSAFSLMIEDYEDLKKQAEEFALGLAGNLDGIGDTPSVSGDAGPVSVSYDFASGGGGVSRNFLELSYASGFAAGVKLYFSLP